MTQKNKSRLKKKIRIIECDSIDLIGKDLIVIKDEKDFNWLLVNNAYVLKLKGTFYIIGNEVAWIYNGIHKNT